MNFLCFNTYCIPRSRILLWVYFKNTDKIFSIWEKPEVQFSRHSFTKEIEMLTSSHSESIHPRRHCHCFVPLVAGSESRASPMQHKHLTWSHISTPYKHTSASGSSEICVPLTCWNCPYQEGSYYQNIQDRAYRKLKTTNRTEIFFQLSVLKNPVSLPQTQIT